MRKILVLLAAVAVMTTSVGATPPSSVTGTFAVVSLTPTDSRTAGGNTFTTAQRTAVLSGTFNGTTTDTVQIVEHANGTTSVFGVGTCVCTIDGQTGTFEYRFQGSGTFPGDLSGQFVVGRATGGLQGLHAQGTFDGTFFVAEVGGRYHFN
jgi:Protein of unknown function (DUF3224)